VAAKIHNEKKWQEWEDCKQKEEEEQKLNEEEGWKKKEEEDWKKVDAEKEVYEKATENARKMKIKLSPQIFCSFQKLIMFQILKKHKEVHRVLWMVVGGVSARMYFQSLGV